MSHLPRMLEAYAPAGTQRQVYLPFSWSSQSSSRVIQDDTTGLIYMDTITASIRRIVLSGLDPGISSVGPTIEDCNWAGNKERVKIRSEQRPHHRRHYGPVMRKLHQKIHCWADRPPTVITLPNFPKTSH